MPFFAGHSQTEKEPQHANGPGARGGFDFTPVEPEAAATTIPDEPIEERRIAGHIVTGTAGGFDSFERMLEKHRR